MPDMPKIDIRPDHWEIVRNILQKHVPMYEVWAFGSRAKWTAKEYSDLDLAIITDKPLSISVSANLSDDFSESDLPWKVDVVDWATTSESFRKVIEKDKVVVKKGSQRASHNLGFPEYWEIKPLNDVMEAVIDYRGKTPRKTEAGIPLITAKIVKGGRVETPEEFIAEDEYDAWMVRGLPKVGDVVVTTEAPLGEVAQLSQSNVALAQRIVTLRGKAGFLDNDYLLFLMQSKYVQEQLESRASGSTVKGIKQSELRKITLPIPPLYEQKEIAKHLKALDDKIELNRQINQTLEQMAQGIFKSWFMDFDPVRAKMEGRDTGLPAHIAGLFPDELVESELGLVPKGWEISNLKSVITELRRGISPKYVEENGVPVINQKCIRNHTINFGLVRLNDQTKKKVDDRLIQVGDVLVNSTGVGTLGRLASVRYLPEPTTFDSHVTVVRADTQLVSKAFLGGLMLVNESFIEASGAGSTGQTELNKQVIEDILFAKPPIELGVRYEAIADPINNEIAVLEREIANLMAIRDSLLPKLLSGEIKVGEAATTE